MDGNQEEIKRMENKKMQDDGWKLYGGHVRILQTMVLFLFDPPKSDYRLGWKKPLFVAALLMIAVLTSPKQEKSSDTTQLSRKNPYPTTTPRLRTLMCM
ncbi:hypothetical protein B9Z55_026415 [Caenorhabditis nigoni]|uniref:Uncharacterized protein n=1 Tax=Caenorhabditis nigoni TaxID=1611254 RepID=A0A2G5T2N5_9PELO|nr:hypothetical protein B9Z55_026415 [Caenorhabditis nigoni]